MVTTMAKELTVQRDYLENKELTSIYFGGGTPSLLNRAHFEQIFNTIGKHFKINSNCEITLEANPDDLSLSKLNTLFQLGVNRLSIGVQSFDDEILKFLNRAHDGKMAISSLENSRQAGFDNISIDLIYAIPGQDHNGLIKNIDTLLQFSPAHISAYSLTIENKTVFGNWVKQKKITPADENTNAEQFEIVSSKLNEGGYEHYEISNYCKPGRHSIHNSNYWKQEPYLGIGPSAHSYNRYSRQFNINNNAQYLKAIHSGEDAFQREILTRENKINEYILTTLRTVWGCNLQKLKTDFDDDVIERKASYVNDLIQHKMATLDNQILRLTHQGKLLADQISLDLSL